MSLKGLTSYDVLRFWNEWGTVAVWHFKPLLEVDSYFAKFDSSFSAALMAVATIWLRFSQELNFPQHSHFHMWASTSSDQQKIWRNITHFNYFITQEKWLQINLPQNNTKMRFNHPWKSENFPKHFIFFVYFVFIFLLILVPFFSLIHYYSFFFFVVSKNSHSQSSIMCE